MEVCVSSLTLPEHNTDRASDIEAEQILHFVRDFEPKELTNDAVPRRAELPVHVVFNDRAAFLEI